MSEGQAPHGLRFLVDESGFQGAKAPLDAAFELLVDRIEASRIHGVGKYSEVWHELVCGRPLFEWLYQPELGVDRVVAEALQIALNRSPNWDEQLDTRGVPLEVTINGVAQTALSVAMAAKSTLAKSATGCISPDEHRVGPLEVGTDGAQVTVHFVGGMFEVLQFFRAVPEIEEVDEETYFAIAAHAFPNIYFVRERTKFSALDEDFDTVRAKVTLHLGVLNDHARHIFHERQDPRIIETVLGAYGVSASGESGNTKANASAMREREVLFNGKRVVCEWHTKLRPHIDRIYFNATSAERVIVGVFRKHL